LRRKRKTEKSNPHHNFVVVRGGIVKKSPFVKKSFQRGEFFYSLSFERMVRSIGGCF